MTGSFFPEKNQPRKFSFIPFCCASFNNIKVWQGQLAWMLYAEKLRLPFSQSMLRFQRNRGREKKVFFSTLTGQNSMELSRRLHHQLTHSLCSCIKKLHTLIPKTVLKIEYRAFFKLGVQVAKTFK